MESDFGDAYAGLGMEFNVCNPVNWCWVCVGSEYTCNLLGKQIHVRQSGIERETVIFKLYTS